MLIRDNDIKLRLPSSQASFSKGEPNEGPFFSATTFRSSTPGIGPPMSIEAAFIGIISILGRATSYLQHGGVKGDTHFPWHSNSKLASLRSELTVWMSSVPQRLQNSGSLDQSELNIASLTINCYHLIHCLIFRDFLPVDYQRESIAASSSAVHRTWQAETTEACIQNANEIATILQAAQSDSIGNIPPFIGYFEYVSV
jgi:hypothetical protein